VPSTGDPVDATRLGLRFAALASALDDLPRRQNASPAGKLAALRSARRKETAMPTRRVFLTDRIGTGRCAPAGRQAGDESPSTRSTRS
jgi:hypothetical protein